MGSIPIGGTSHEAMAARRGPCLRRPCAGPTALAQRQRPTWRPRAGAPRFFLHVHPVISTCTCSFSCMHIPLFLHVHVRLMPSPGSWRRLAPHRGLLRPASAAGHAADMWLRGLTACPVDPVPHRACPHCPPSDKSGGIDTSRRLRRKPILRHSLIIVLHPLPKPFHRVCPLRPYAHDEAVLRPQGQKP